MRRWYEPHLERIHDDAPARKADLMQLEQIAAGYPSRERFLTELTLDPPDATSDEAGAAHLDEDYLILSTIHSAKGQEWSAVFLLNAVDGCIPSDLAAGETEEIEEERRLLYVAMTRAKHQLDIVVPQRFYVHQQSRGGDRHLYASRTRFVPDALLALFEQRTWPVRTQEPGLRRPGERRRGSTSRRDCGRGGGKVWRIDARSVNPIGERPDPEDRSTVSETADAEDVMAQPFVEPCSRGIIDAQPCPRELGREISPHRRRMVLAGCVLASSMAFVDGIGTHGRAAQAARRGRRRSRRPFSGCSTAICWRSRR